VFTWFRRRPATPITAPLSTQEPSVDIDGVLDDVRSLTRSRSEAEVSLPKFREAVASSGFDAKVMLEYARFLIQASRGSTAEEVLALSLAKNGAQVDALELYQELVRELDLPGDRSSWAFERLAADISAHPEEHRGALDFAIPHKLTKVLTAVASAGDPVSQAIVQINQAYADKSFSEATLESLRSSIGPNDLVRAHLTVALARGNRKVATELLKSADRRAVPVNALRRAIRRARATGKQKQLVEYLEQYRALRPDDGWAKSLQNQVQRN